MYESSVCRQIVVVVNNECQIRNGLTTTQGRNFQVSMLRWVRCAVDVGMPASDADIRDVEIPVTDDFRPIAYLETLNAQATSSVFIFGMTIALSGAG